MPNKESIALWVEALRSGKYRQKRYALRAGDRQSRYKYCCLGVACEVAKANGVELPAETWSTTALPVVVQDWLGVGSYNPIVGSKLVRAQANVAARIPVDAMNANDSLGWDFRRIADGIEETYLI